MQINEACGDGAAVVTTRNTAAISKLSDWVRSSAWEGRIVPAACLNYDEFDQRYVVNEPATRQRSRLLEQLQPSQRSWPV